MDKEEFLKMGGNPDFIPGIYNYCDRWCERCAFSKRCMNFAMGEELFPDQESRDINNKKFWEGLHNSFQLTIELLNDFAKEQGTDLNAIDYEEEGKKHKARRNKTKAHPLVKASDTYATMVTEWFEKYEGLFEEKQQVLNRQLQLGIENPKATAASILDGVDVIHWYQYQIQVKLMRALNGDEFEQDVDEEMKEFPKDSDGSAKVALIGIDRSMGAWGEMKNIFLMRVTAS